MNSAHEKFQLLIIDDDPTVVEVLFEALAQEDFELSVADDGELALELVHQSLPDLILLDMVMPNLDGIEVCRRLKADPATRDAPVILMTAHDDPRQRIRAFQAGGVDYVRKPFETEELLARVRTQLSIRRLMRELKARNEALEDEIRERALAEEQRELLTHELFARTEELRLAKEQLERELKERAETDGARCALQEEVIAVQRTRLAELSTPLIPITKHIVVMPLIGIMDVDRAARVMETALSGAASRRTSCVILDITGVRDVDARVADMLVQTGNGLRLLGAHAVITGVTPEVAQLFVSLRISLGSLATKATLQDGIAYAMRTFRARRRRDR